MTTSDRFWVGWEAAIDGRGATQSLLLAGAAVVVAMVEVDNHQRFFAAV